jgi:hypothetical protein
MELRTTMRFPLRRKFRARRASIELAAAARWAQRVVQLAQKTEEELAVASEKVWEQER